MIQERPQHLNRTTGATAASQSNSAPLPASSSQHFYLPRAGPGGFSSAHSSSQAAQYRGLGGMRPAGQPGGFDSLPEHGAPTSSTASWGLGPADPSESVYGTTPAGGLGLGIPLQGSGKRPGSTSERAAGGTAAGFSAGSGGFGRSSFGDRSSIGISTPLSTPRPPPPLQHYKSGDYSQELPREESWFV